jgi:hypothetical protein
MLLLSYISSSNNVFLIQLFRLGESICLPVFPYQLSLKNASLYDVGFSIFWGEY